MDAKFIRDAVLVLLGIAVAIVVLAHIFAARGIDVSAPGPLPWM